MGKIRNFFIKQHKRGRLRYHWAVGYQTEAHFSKAFKSAYQRSPSQYRK